MKSALHVSVLFAAAAASLMGRPAFAAADQAPYCTASMVDFRVWPAFQPKPGNGVHLIVIEIQSRAQEACTLAELEFYPVNDWIQFSREDPSEAAQQMYDRKNRLEPGELVHQLLVWSSAPKRAMGLPEYNCRARDEVELTLGRIFVKTEPDLTIRNLQLESCGGWLSSYRAGSYMPEKPAPPARWLYQFDLPPEGLTPAFPVQSGEAAPARAEVSLHALYDVQLLKHVWEINLSLLHPAAAGCPFEVMRKREADGKTTIYLDHCEVTRSSWDDSGRQKPIVVDLRALGLQPERSGMVEYQAISQVMENNVRLLERSQPIQIMVRDDRQQLMPAIDSKIPACEGSQLHLSREPVRLGPHWDAPRAFATAGKEKYFARVYEFTNTSGSTCLLGGVPELSFVDSSEKRVAFLDLYFCGSCGSPLFQPRVGEWIDLKPNDSAHFIVGTKALDPDYLPFCTVIDNLDFGAPGGGQWTMLAYGAATCGEVFVSTWRAGRYDDDPLNTRYAGGRNSVGQVQDEPTPLPRECADANVQKLGRPVLVNEGIRNKLLFGFSVGNGRATYGQEVPIYFWMVNQSDQPQTFMSCDVQWFQRDGFDVLDAGGHRVLTKDEQKNPQYRRSDVTFPFDYVCDMNAFLTIAPHACNRSEEPFNLAEFYVLTDGEYVISPRKTADYAEIQGQHVPPKVHPGRLVISIEPPRSASGSHRQTEERKSSEVVP